MNDYKYLENQKQTIGEDSLMKKLLKKRLNQKGLTLIELLAVIVILAIVAAIAIPAIGNLINNSRDKAVLADASTVLSSAKIAVSDGSCTEATTTTGSPAVTTTTVTCDTDTLQPYVEGVELTDGDKAIRTNGKWVVTFDKLKTIKNVDKFTVAPSAAGATDGFTPSNSSISISDYALSKAMNQ